MRRLQAVQFLMDAEVHWMKGYHVANISSSPVISAREALHGQMLR